MKNNTKLNLLALQIKRLLIPDKDRQRLSEELKALDTAKMEYLARLIQEHDLEAMEILNKKAAEQSEIKTRFQTEMEVRSTPEEKWEAIREMGKVLEDPEKFARFVGLADDVVLSQLEQVLLLGSKEDTGSRTEIKQFFDEIRLQKANLDKKFKADFKALLIKNLSERKEAMSRLDQAVARAKEAMARADKKAVARAS